jgi:hypothetical protein
MSDDQVWIIIYFAGAQGFIGGVYFGWMLGPIWDKWLRARVQGWLERLMGRNETEAGGGGR